jgi:hypothetical protein
MFSRAWEIVGMIARGALVTFAALMYALAAGTAALGFLLELGWSGILGWAVIIAIVLGYLYVKSELRERRELRGREPTRTK